MNNWKLRAVYSGDNTMDFVEVNGYLAGTTDSEPLMRVVPFGDKFAAPLRTAASETHGPVSNQVPGISNGTFTHTGSGSATVSATTLTGEGSGATFTYTFLADGTLSTIKAAAGGSNYLVGDKLRITTSASHGSQVIEFRLVDGSNGTVLNVRLTHDRNNPLPFPVHRARVNESTSYTFQVLDYRSSQVFPRPQDKLLDKYPDAAAAYGLRLLRSAYLGPAIRVRKNVTGAPEKDIFFDSQGNLDTKTLLDFAGDETLLVKTFHDQSGNGNDASQTISASMPKIVDAGTLVTVNGKPALEFDGTDDGFFAQHDGLYGQARFDAYMHYQTDDTVYLMFTHAQSSGNHSFVAQNTSTSTSLTGGYGGADVELYVNGVKANLVDGTTDRDDLYDIMVVNAASHSNGAVVVHQDALTTTWTNFLIGNYGGSLYFDGKLTEMVLYNTDQSANRENIEKDMALHSGAYQVEDAPLLDAYGGAHAAYSLRKLNSDYTGYAVRVSRDGDNAEMNVGFDADGNLDTASIEATFYTGSNIRIKTWYDQSGNGNDITQATVANRPLLYNNSGSLKVDGRSAMYLNGNSHALPFDATGLDIGNLSSFIVSQNSNITGEQMALALSGTAGDKRWYAPYMTAGTFYYGYAGSSTAVSTTANTANNLHTAIAGATQGDFEAFLNGASLGTATLASGIDTASTGIGNQDGNYYHNGFIQEVIVYSSDQSERREGIERNISNHYDL